MSVNILAGTITASVPAHGTVMYQAADGTQVDIRTCTGGSNQVWTPPPPGSIQPATAPRV